MLFKLFFFLSCKKTKEFVSEDVQEQAKQVYMKN